MFSHEIQQFIQALPEYFEKVSPPLKGLGLQAFEGTEDFVGTFGNTLEAMTANIFNVLFVLGLSSTIEPVAVPQGGHIDFGVLVVFSVVLLPIAFSHQHKIVRLEGLFLVACYSTYILWRVLI